MVIRDSGRERQLWPNMINIDHPTTTRPQTRTPAGHSRPNRSSSEVLIHGPDGIPAPSKEEALQRLRDEFGRRLKDSGCSTQAFAFTDAVYRKHLQEPVPGVYAMDIGLYNELRETESDADLNRAFHEAEQRRVKGQPYTTDDYFRNRGEHQA